MPVVSNSSPLIALEQIRQLDLLQSLFTEILIPDQVAAETVASIQPRSWIRQQSLSLPVLPVVQRPTLGLGEREAICLAVEVHARAILLDDDPARKLAIQLGLPVIGTAGVLVLAKERHLICRCEAVPGCVDREPLFPGTCSLRVNPQTSWGNVNNENTSSKTLTFNYTNVDSVVSIFDRISFPASPCQAWRTRLADSRSVKAIASSS
jgi:uncharacterized protein